jgi:hypothetical protein
MFVQSRAMLMPLDSLLNHGGLASPRRSHSWSCVQCRDQRGDSGTGATLIIQFRRVRTSTTTIQGGPANELRNDSEFCAQGLVGHVREGGIGAFGCLCIPVQARMGGGNGARRRRWMYHATGHSAVAAGRRRRTVCSV